MKIEMGESLMQSYLKHIKGCFITQTNWKTLRSWKKSNEDKAKAKFEKIKKEYPNIFSEKTKFEKMLNQAELDVIGIANDKIYMVEIAFHEQGLRYGNDDNKVRDRVLKKMIRAYLIWKIYFSNYSCEIIFASPKVNPSPDGLLNECFSKLAKDNFYKEDKVEFKYLSNKKFKDEILLPTLETLKSDSDTSELFLRSAKLLKICKIIK
ncbi:hypothetical protein [Brachyspira aalborgi]|uniref:Uncharacterized protein n=1 Tax=Brachyspira aalborgi TaxID=29522 RepID=A0A5C8CDR3_9SPIR|nr:hypothetical protein [Brachyspira aalborgi]TXJ11106.1 hypothetical protein EPJ80_10790 [Brachyspira aalborgi]